MSDTSKPVDPVVAGHEGSNISARVAIGAVVAIVVLLAVAFWLSAAFIGGLAEEPDPLQNDRSDLARLKKPTVLLNPAQPALRRELHDEQQAMLTTYGWIDEQAGVAHLPIDAAMTLLVERGLSADAAPAEKPDEPTGEDGR